VDVSTDGGATWTEASGTTNWSYECDTAGVERDFEIRSRATDNGGNLETPGSGVTIFVDNAGPAPGQPFTRQEGSASSDIAKAVFVDGSGNVYAAGYTSGGLDGYTNAGSNDIVVFKYSPQGIKLWSRQIGSTAADSANGVAADASGNVYVAGNTSGGLDGNALIGSSDFFVIKYDHNGTKLWTLQMGTTSNDYANGIAVDASGNIFVAGGTYGGLYGNVTAGSEDIFVVKLDAAGNRLWTRQAGTNNTECAYGVGVDAGGNVYAAGAGYYYYSSGGSSGTFWSMSLVKYDTNGTRAWADFGDADLVGFPNAMATDGNGNSYLAGGTPAYLVKFNSSGVKTATVSTNYTANAVSVDASGNVYTAGTTASGLDGNVGLGGNDAFLVKYDTGLNRVSTRQIGSSANDYGTAVTVDPFGAPHLAGYTTGGMDGYTNTGMEDIFVEKFEGVQAVVINGGGVSTSSTSAALLFSVQDRSDVAQMRISNDGVFDTEPWEQYAAQKEWTLTSGSGVKTVNAKFMDTLGNESAAYLDTIALDTGPASSITFPAEGQVITGTPATITGTVYDYSPDTTTVEVSTDGGATWNTATGTTSWSYSWTIPGVGSYNIRARATDTAGHVETPGPGVNVTVATPIVLSCESVNLTYTAGSMPSNTCVDISCGIGALGYTVSSDSPWLTVTPSAGTTPGTITLTARLGDQTPGFFTGHATVVSPGAINSPCVVTVNLTITPYGDPELPHYNWDASLSGGNCNACHITTNRFLAPGFRNDNSFCYSCHNVAGISHEKALIQRGHSTMVNATTGWNKMPTYGTTTTSEYNNQPFARLNSGKVVCVTCHNPMRKSEDMGRTWEYTTTTDNRTYMMQNGGWAGYNSLVPKVYRDTSLWAGPTYSKTKKDYLVDPSEYTYNETNGTVTFLSAQIPTTYVYISLDYPYLRASNAGNTLCSDCHAQITHRGDNCQTCHAAHNTGNIKGIRESLRTSNHSSVAVRFLGLTGANSFADGDGTHDGICEVCHTQTKYYRRDGTGFVSHSGGFDYNGKACTNCHGHSNGFGR
jgi:hypothetical protein